MTFRDEKFRRDQDDEGFVRCGCLRIGLPDCGRYSNTPDLHHIIGRDINPALYYDESNLVWLHPDCHRYRLPEAIRQGVI